MDNENELLAQWLFGPSDHTDEYGNKLWRQNGERVWGTPNFRAFSDWAAALLEKLTESGYEPQIGFSPRAKWACVIRGFRVSGLDTWRDAVVDAALEIIKRESQDNGSGDA